MTTEPVRAVLLEDNASDRRLYARRLSRKGQLHVEPIAFKGDDSEVRAILADDPDLLLLDYELETGDPTTGLRPGRGSTFAAILREKLPNVPIVLVSRGSLIESKAFGSAIDLSAAFDAVIQKGWITGNADGVREELLALVRGFQELARKRRRDWTNLLNAIGAAQKEEAELRRTGPPGFRRVSDECAEWRVSETAHWIRKALLAFPGVLYTPLHAAAAIGLSERAFLSKPVRKLFATAEYVGPFAPASGAWWKGRLLDLAYQLLELAGLEPTRYAEVAAAWQKRHKGKLTPSTCVYSGKKGADCVCYILKKPVCRQYSLPYEPDNRPEVMDEARVSFRAIRESEDFDESLVAPDARDLVVPIQSGELGQ